MISHLRKIKDQILVLKRNKAHQQKINAFIKGGKIPWTEGYHEYRGDRIKEALDHLPQKFNNWGVGIDERIVEIPWVIKNLSVQKTKILDAGSSFNHDYVLDSDLIRTKDLTICTYYPESYARYSQRISYVYSDLRELPFKDFWFDEIVCISTLEHIDMDNSMYGYHIPVMSINNKKSYSYLEAVIEMIRVLRLEGKLFITVPFGRFENHSFFQQFDEEMLRKLIDTLKVSGEVKLDFFKYTKAGWNLSVMEDCEDERSFNPHTGIGKGNDGAAHSRSIACVSFSKLR